MGFTFNPFTGKLDATGKDTSNTINGSRGTPRDVVAANGITESEGHMSTTALVQTTYIQGSGGSVNITADPQIEAGEEDSQTMRLIGRSDTNTVILEDGAGLSMNSLIELGEDDAITFMFDSSVWVELSRNI